MEEMGAGVEKVELCHCHFSFVIDMFLRGVTRFVVTEDDDCIAHTVDQVNDSTALAVDRVAPPGCNC